MESWLKQKRKSTTLSTAFVLDYQEGIASLSSQSLGKQTRPGEGQVGHLAWTYHSEGPIRSIPLVEAKGNSWAFGKEYWYCKDNQGETVWMKKVPKFNQQEMVTTFTYKLKFDAQGSMHAI